MQPPEWISSIVRTSRKYPVYSLFVIVSIVLLSLATPIFWIQVVGQSASGFWYVLAGVAGFALGGLYFSWISHSVQDRAPASATRWLRILCLFHAPLYLHFLHVILLKYHQQSAAGRVLHAEMVLIPFAFVIAVGSFAIRWPSAKETDWLSNPLQDSEGKRIFDYLLSTALVIAFSMILLMALRSDFRGQHPDEHVHISCSRYYTTHWMPPKIGDPEVTHTYSGYGHSRLNNFGLQYFLSGKLSKLFIPLIKDDVTSFRLFNVTLFLILLLIFLSQVVARNDTTLVFVPLVITPQLWYIFSYMNDDAFPLFLSIVISWMIVNRNSLFNRFLNAEKLFGNWIGMLVGGGLFGVLLMHKINNYIFLLFVALFAAYHWIRNSRVFDSFSLLQTRKKMWEKRGIFVKYALVAVTAFAVYGGRYALDLSINGWDRGEKITHYEEKLAKGRYKPSLKESDINQSYYGLWMRDKGVPLSKLITKWKWHRKTEKSFFGVYGYMVHFSPQIYFSLMRILYVFLLVYMFMASLLYGEKNHLLLIVMFVFILVFGVTVSLYNSWVKDFQAQGRYLFPLLPTFGILLFALQRHLRFCVINVMIFAIFVNASFSFLFALEKILRSWPITMYSFLTLPKP